MITKRHVIAFALYFCLATGACTRAHDAPEPSGAPSVAHDSVANAAAPLTTGRAQSGQATATTTRQVIRRAELALTVSSTTRAEDEVTRIAERHGGYVAEATRNVSADESGAPASSVSLGLRVPAQHLTKALAEIRRIGTGERSERLFSEDVTDEFIDVEAKIANLRRLEQQLAELLKTANSVEPALKVHHELASARTEMDRLEGRRRFLEKASALANVSVTLSPVAPVVGVSLATFAINARHAASDAVAVASGVAIATIRLLGVAVPLALLAGPLFLLLRRVFRSPRSHRREA